MEMNGALPLAEQIDAVLPQTQCTQCGYASCRPYAEALATKAAAINRCPPGGARGIERLAEVTGEAVMPLNPSNGREGPFRLARIDEPLCIGCTLCIQACPVDAIVGAARLMHSVIGDLCTGCGLCVAPCPVDCIVMDATDIVWTTTDADRARTRFHARAARLARSTRAAGPGLAATLPDQAASAEAARPAPIDDARKQQLILAAVERARLQRAAAPK